MIRSLKILAVSMLILSILCCIGGVICSNLSEANKGLKVTPGYSSNGVFIANDDDYVIGANEKGEKAMTVFSILFYVISVLSFVASVGFIITAKKKVSAKAVWRNGRVLEKINNFSVIVEFDDTSRQRMIIENSLMLIPGDTGTFSCKGNLILDFQKR